MPSTKKHPQIPVWEAFDSDELKEVWNTWIEFRKEKKFTSYVPTGLKMTITKLRKMANGNEKTMIGIIQQSMTGKGWEGFWPLKEEISIKQDLNNLTEHFTPKDEQTQPTASPQPQQATQLEIPQDWSEHWEDLQDKARKGISPIIVMPIYYWLCQTGRLVLTIEEKKELFKRAKEHYVLQLTAYAIPQERHILRKITQPGWEKDLELLESVRTKAKILGVKDYLYESIKPVKA